MNIKFKSLPVGDLPYDKIDLAIQMSMRLYADSPFVFLMPKFALNENLIYRTFSNTKFLTIKNNKLKLNKNSEDLEQLNDFYNDIDMDIEKFSFNSAFLEKYFAIIKKFKPENSIINFIGPFEFVNMIMNIDINEILTDKNIRKFIIQYYCIKTKWIINKIKALNPATVPIIIFEEPRINKLGLLIKANEELNNDIIINLYSKIISKIKSYGAYICVQCFEKCNWQILIDAGIDMISFDAYNNPANLNIIPEKINSFLANGGYINWGIMPVKNEEIIKSMNLDRLLNMFTKITNDLISNGVSADLLYAHSTVSVQGNTSNLPVIFAEKAHILVNQLSKKISRLK